MTKFNERIEEYFKILDCSLEKLCNHHEGKIIGLPSWTLANRKVTIGLTEDGKGVALRVSVDENLEGDFIEQFVINSDENIHKIISPWELEFQNRRLPKMPFIIIGDLTVVEAKNPLAIPIKEDKYFVGYGNIDDALKTFSVEKAHQDALNFWNQALVNRSNSRSYVHETRTILLKFKLIVKRKNFLERRIHRFINEHRSLLLPTHSRCLYEHLLYLGDQKRKADFILELEPGIPAILIELENPTHKVFRKDGELTARANHAKNQIAEWVQFIDSDAQRNASGEFSFLSGPKQRLVIMGKGLDNKEKLVNTKFTDTTFWTYELFLDQAKKRLNDQYASQCQIIGIDETRPFR